MKSSLRVSAVAVFAAAAASCASSSGPSGLPPASAPTSPPAAGGDPAGDSGEVSGDGAIGSAFLGLPSPEQVSVTIDEDADGAERLTLVVASETVVFDLSKAQTKTLADGFFDLSVVEADGWTAREVTLDFDNRKAQSRLFLFDEPSAGVTGALSVRKDPSMLPDIPTSGVATFDTKLVGSLTYPVDLPGDELVFGRGEMQADFGSGDVLGEFPDIDFVADGQVSETSRLGHDFGLHMEGSVVDGGDIPLLIVSTTPLDTGEFMDMLGDGSGALLGAPGGAPNGIAGAFRMMTFVEPDPAAELVGGFEGRCVCFEPGP